MEININNAKKIAALEMAKNLARYINENNIDHEYILAEMMNELKTVESKKSDDEILFDDMTSYPITFHEVQYKSGRELIDRYNVPVEYIFKHFNNGCYNICQIVDTYIGYNMEETAHVPKREQNNHLKEKKGKIGEVVVDGVVYKSKNDACRQLHLPVRTIYSLWKKNRDLTFEQVVNLYLDTPKGHGRPPKPFNYKDQTYNSLQDACYDRNVAYDAVLGYSTRYKVSNAVAFGVITGDISPEEELKFNHNKNKPYKNHNK